MNNALKAALEAAKARGIDVVNVRLALRENKSDADKVQAINALIERGESVKVEIARTTERAQVETETNRQALTTVDALTPIAVEAIPRATRGQGKGGRGSAIAFGKLGSYRLIPTGIKRTDKGAFVGTFERAKAERRSNPYSRYCEIAAYVLAYPNATAREVVAAIARQVENDAQFAARFKSEYVVGPNATFESRCVFFGEYVIDGAIATGTDPRGYWQFENPDAPGSRLTREDAKNKGLTK